MFADSLNWERVGQVLGSPSRRQVLAMNPQCAFGWNELWGKRGSTTGGLTLQRCVFWTKKDMKDEDYEDIMKILDDMNIYELFFKERELMGHFFSPPINFFSAGHFHIKNGSFFNRRFLIHVFATGSIGVRGRYFSFAFPTVAACNWSVEARKV